MSNPTNEFQDLWQKGGGDVAAPNFDQQGIMQRGRSPQQESVRAQQFTIAILSVLLVVLLFFFRYLSPVEATLSLVGKWLMIGSILVRIGVEIASLVLAKKIDFLASASNFVRVSRRLVRFRAGVHQYLVVITFALYSIGYYLIMPEWSLYFSKPMIWLLILSYVVIMALVILLSIRPGMRRERLALDELERLVEELEQA